MKLKEFYEKPLSRAVDKMNLIDVKAYPDADGEVQAVLLKYAPQHDSRVLCIPPRETVPVQKQDGPTIAKQEVLKAYEVIRRHCSERKADCTGCPLARNENWGCATGYGYVPQNWPDFGTW